MTEGVRKICNELATADGQRVDELICEGLFLIGAIGGLGVSANDLIEAFKLARVRLAVDPG